MIYDKLQELPSDAEPWIVDHEPIVVTARDERIPAAEVADAAARAATALRERGVVAGTRCIVWLDSPVDNIVAYAAVTALDAVPILISRTLPGRTLAKMVADVPDVAVFVATDERLAEGRELLPDLAHLDWREIAAALPGCRRLSRPKEVRSDAAYVVVHTSGTTNVPKLVECSSASIWFNAKVQAVLHRLSRLRGHLAFELSAVHGRTVVGILAALMRKAPLLVLSDPDPDHVERVLKRHRPVFLETHPNTFRAWQHLAERGAFRSIRVFGCGFDVIHPDTVWTLLRGSDHRFAAFGEVYGMNEAGPVAIRMHVKGLPRLRHRRSKLLRGHGAGPRFHFCKVRILDDDGNPVRPGTPGRIVVRTPGVFSGYLNRPDLTSRNYPLDRWWDTGDWGSLSRFGFLTLVDRGVDKVSGAPSGIGIEDVLLEKFPEYLELVVLGMGGTLQPVISMRPGHEFDERAWRRESAKVADMAAPLVVPLEVLPRTVTGKVQREQLKRTLAARAAAPAPTGASA